MKALECIRCHVQMEVGFVADMRPGGYSQQNWCPGEPKSNWIGLKVESDQFIPVRTLRCPNCGYLEAYALNEKVSKH
jgi:predicted nucleic-acid-binding Zn-ribbon protein